MGTTPISTLAIAVGQRLEEIDPANPVFWTEQFEVYTALVEAMSDLLLMVGRPTSNNQVTLGFSEGGFGQNGFGGATLQPYNLPFTLTPNSVWQSIPRAIFLITDIQGPSSPLWRTTLYEMDNLLVSWDSGWEADTAETPQRWFPLGFNMFGVHPAPSYPIQVIASVIAYPVIDAWPYSGSQPVPFNSVFFPLLEEYAAAYCRLKEAGAEFQEGEALYQEYLSLASRMAAMEDKRDQFLFSKNMGARANLDPVTRR